MSRTDAGSALLVAARTDPVGDSFLEGDELRERLSLGDSGGFIALAFETEREFDSTLTLRGRADEISESSEERIFLRLAGGGGPILKETDERSTRRVSSVCFDKMC